MGFELLLPLLLLLPLVLIIMRTRRQQREMAEMQQRLTPGQEVMTSSGLFGTIVEVHPDSVTLQVADGVRTRWAKPAIARVVTASGGATDSDTPPAG
jgi:preprotein translocase subunit YajC